MKYEVNSNYLAVTPLVKDIENYFQRSTKILYDKRNEIRLVEFEEKKYVVKLFCVPNLINQYVYHYLRSSKAKRSYQYSKKIGESLCPAAIAYREEYNGARLAKSYYISSYFDYDFTINALLINNSHEDYIKILELFADFTYTLHEKGILHRDYSHGNILIKKEGADYQFRIIDVNRMQFRSLSLDDRLNNFSRLSANDEVMNIVISRYAQHIKVSADKALNIAISHRNKHMKKRRMKNKLRGR
jgi:serine/threonine protein kinase